MAKAKKSDDPFRIERLFNALKDSKEIVYDTETSGLHKHLNFPIGYVFTCGPRPDETWYIPLRHQGGGNVPGQCRVPKHATDFLAADISPFERRLAEIAEDPSKHWVGHNIKFDMWMSHRAEISFAGTVEDTLVNASLLDENQKQYALGICARVMGVTAKKSEEIEAHIKATFAGKFQGDKAMTNMLEAEPMGFFWMLSATGMATEYATGDGITTRELVYAQRKRIEEEQLHRVWAVEKRTTKTLFNIERRGVPVDENRLELVAAKASKTFEELSAKLPKGLNVKSSPQVAKYLQEHCGIADIPKTPTGAPSVTEKFLENFEKGQEIIAIRQIRNLMGTFIESSIRGHLYKGRVHCSFNQIKSDEYGVVTGRLSSSDPNMQQIPKRNKILAPLIRQLYRHPHFAWLSKDYSQQEYRVFADFAKAKLVLEAYARDPNTDYHQLVADLLEVERDPAAKRINLGTIYAMGAAKLAFMLGVPLSVAQGYLSKMRQMMPEAASFNRGCEDVAKRRGYVRTVLGRRRRFPDPQFARKAGNSVIQGSSADITKLKMCEVDEFLIAEKCESQLILQIHDSLETLLCPDEASWLPGRLKEMMEDFSKGQPIELTVPMKVDMGQGVSWGHSTFPKYNQWV